MTTLSPTEAARLRALVHENPWVTLATTDQDGPYGAMVAAAWDAPRRCAWLHLSQLALHTRHLLADPRACLVWSENGSDVVDPQTLLRVSMRITATPVARDHADYAAAKAVYCARLPESTPLFSFADFVLFRAQFSQARVVFGFARALAVDLDSWCEWISG